MILKDFIQQRRRRVTRLIPLIHRVQKGIVMTLDVSCPNFLRDAAPSRSPVGREDRDNFREKQFKQKTTTTTTSKSSRASC